MIDEWRSKLATLAIAGSLVLVEFVLLMVIPVVKRVYNNPGLMVLAFTLIAAAVICLERATVPRFSEVWRARGGILGGLLAWLAVELAVKINGGAVDPMTWAITLTLAILVTVTVWRRGLGVGLQFFLLTLLFGWIGHTILILFMFLQNGWLVSINVFGWTALIFGACALGVAAWTMLRSQTRAQRQLLAVMLWFCMIIVLFSLRGGTI